MSNSSNQDNNNNKPVDQLSVINNHPDTPSQSTRGFRSTPASFDIAMPAQIQTNFVTPHLEFPHHYNPSLNLHSQQLQLHGMGLMQPPDVSQMSIQNAFGIQQALALNEVYNSQNQLTTNVSDAYVYSMQSNLLGQGSVSSHNPSFPTTASADKVSVQQSKVYENHPPTLNRPVHLPQYAPPIQSTIQYQQAQSLQSYDPSYVSSTSVAPKTTDSTALSKSTDVAYSTSTSSSIQETTNELPSESSSSSSPFVQLPSRSGKKQRKSLSTLHEMTPETALRNRCRICNKQFKRPSSLQTHYYSHTGEKIFKCPWQGCGKMFSVKSNMTRHYRLHERDSRRAQEADFQSRNPELMRALGLSSNSSTVRQYFQPMLHHNTHHHQPHHQQLQQQQQPHHQHQQLMPLQFQQLDPVTIGSAQAQPRDLSQLDAFHRPLYQSYSPLSSQVPSLMQSQYMLTPIVVDGNMQTEQLRVSEAQQSPVQTINARLP